jgi:hypothetical protein
VTSTTVQNLTPVAKRFVVEARSDLMNLHLVTQPGTDVLDYPGCMMMLE